jgi:hypothetical protein
MAFTSSQEFLEELKKQYDRVFEIKKDLESKANNIMTVSGTVGTLLFGFGVFLVDKLGHTYALIIPISILLIVGIAADIVALSLSARAFGIMQYRFAIVAESFYKNGRLNSTEIDDYRKMQKEEFYETMIWEYIKCINENFGNNNSRAALIVPSQWFLMVSVLIIPIVIGLLLTKLPGT